MREFLLVLTVCFLGTEISAQKKKSDPEENIGNVLGKHLLNVGTIGVAYRTFHRLKQSEKKHPQLYNATGTGFRELLKPRVVKEKELEEIREYAPKPRDFDAEEIVQLLAEPGSEAELKEASKKADLFLHTAEAPEVIFFVQTGLKELLKPVEPEYEGKPVQPDNIGKPVQPDNIGKPVQPENIGKPVKPEYEGKPVKPENIGKPVKPENIGKPVQPEYEEKPVQPKYERKPVQPENKGKPVQPEYEGKPVQPEYEGKPVQPEYEGKPVQPENIGKPVQPEKEAKPIAEIYKEGEKPKVASSKKARKTRVKKRKH